MALSIWFWFIFALWVLLGVRNEWPVKDGKYWGFGGTIVGLVLLGILGWKVFGPAVK